MAATKTSRVQNGLNTAGHDCAAAKFKLSKVSDSVRYSFQPAPTSRLPFLREDTCTAQLAKQEVAGALQQAQPYVLLPALLKTLHDPTFVRSLPATTFQEIIRLLDPKFFLERIRHIHHWISPASINICSDNEPQVGEVFKDYENVVLSILHIRRSGGHKLGLEEHRVFLSNFSHIGSGQAAWRVWKSMKKGGGKPDLECYNL